MDEYKIMDESLRISGNGKVRNRWIVGRCKVKSHKRRKERIDVETGEVHSKGSEYHTDSSKFIKLYDISFLRKISKQGFNLVLYILDNIQYGNMVLIDRYEFSRLYGISPKCVYKFINELTDKCFIYRDSREIYFVNPNMIAFGQRHVATESEICASSIVAKQQ